MCPFFKVAISCTLYMAQLSTPYMYVRRGIGGWMSHGFYPLKNLLCPVAQTGRTVQLTIAIFVQPEFNS